MTTLRSDDERIARAELSYLAEPGDPLLGKLVRASGPVEAMKLIRADRQAGWPEAGVSGDAQRAMSRWHAALEKAPSRAEVEDAIGRPGIRLVCPGDTEWPGRLNDLGDAQPHALWLRGSADLGFACNRSVAIVGSRAATAYGSYVAAEFAASIAERGWAVVSGGAFGVDASAHRGALGADGVTIAVLACGVDVPYPVGHADLLEAIAAQGVIVSEWPPGAIVSRLRFLTRNRVIAALATATLVVEAGERSGAMTTARHALSLSRLVAAVPGPITSDLSRGPNSLIREHRAILAIDGGEVIDTALCIGQPAET